MVDPFHWRLDEPFWRSKRMLGESLFFVRVNPGEPAGARLLFPPSGPVKITSASREIEFEDGVDFVADPATGIVTLPRNSRIPFTDRASLYPPVGQEHSIPHKRGEEGTGLFFGEGHFFHDLQAEAFYEHDSTWREGLPESRAELLPETARKLRAAASLKICVMGDSISVGANASGRAGVPPNMPPYPVLWAEELRRLHGSDVVLKNFAVGGEGVHHGMKVVDQVTNEDPDLVLVAYGMNNAGSLPASQYLEQTTRMADFIRQKSPKTELVLVASMLGNPEWQNTPTENFFRFRDALQSLSGPGVALADLTRVWADLLQFKSYHDLTGNGVNHPNDFGHRIYAQVLLELLRFRQPGR